jgi:8-oxo-dGTP pyrophosphatase MutT (NUDIX family)
MSLLSLDQIRQSIDDHSPSRHDVLENTRQAAVAAILRNKGDHTEALFILRATKNGDPWSGHMAFPGGHKDQTDQDLRETAERETREEIDLDLTRHAHFLGQLDAVRANPRRDLDMVVTPFVYHLHSDQYDLNPNHEVADVLWGSLNDMYTGTSFTTGQFRIRGEHQGFPGYGVGGQLVWGLTYRMIDNFFLMMDPGWESHD